MILNKDNWNYEDSPTPLNCLTFLGCLGKVAQNSHIIKKSRTHTHPLTIGLSPRILDCGTFHWELVSSVNGF